MTSPAAISDQATINNQRLFTRYAQIFQNPDPTSFAGHANKFSNWLSDHKAYYVSARPEIVRLLLVAQLTLRRALHIPEDPATPFNIHDYLPHPLIPPYVQLVQAVLPFENMFGAEPSLISHIHTLRETITPRYTNNIEPGPPQASILSQSGNPHIVNIKDSIAPLAPIGPEIQVIESRPRHSSVQISQSKSLSTMAHFPMADDDIQIIENPSPPLSTPSGSRNTQSQLQSIAAPLKKVKKRKTLNLAALAQTDVQSLLPKKEADTQPSQGSSTSANADQHSLLPSVPLVNTPLEHNSQSLTSSIQQAPTVDVSALLGSDTAAAPAKTPDGLDVPNISTQSAILPLKTSSNSLEFQVKAERPHSPDIPMEVDLSEADDLPRTDIAESRNVVSIPETSVSTEPLDLEEPKASQGAPETRQEIQDPSAMIVALEELASTSLPALAPDVTMQDGEETADADNISHSVITSTEAVFDSSMRVAGQQNGMAGRRRLRFGIDITQAQFESILKWQHRSKSNSLQDIVSSTCMSFGCYPIADLEELSRRRGLNTLEQQTIFARSVWPLSGTVIMDVRKADGTRQHLPVSPLQVTPDNLVDVTSFLTVGHNDIDLCQYEDMSQYIFVLHAHIPTSAQLRHWQQQNDKNKEWENWLRHVTRPLDVGSNPYGPPPT